MNPNVKGSRAPPSVRQDLQLFGCLKSPPHSRSPSPASSKRYQYCFNPRFVTTPSRSSVGSRSQSRERVRSRRSNSPTTNRGTRGFSPPIVNTSPRRGHLLHRRLNLVNGWPTVSRDSDILIF